MIRRLFFCLKYLLNTFYFKAFLLSKTNLGRYRTECDYLIWQLECLYESKNDVKKPDPSRISERTGISAALSRNAISIITIADASHTNSRGALRAV